MLKEYQGILQMILWVLQHLWNGKIIWKTQLPKPIQKETENLDMSIECKEVKCIIKDISQRKLVISLLNTTEILRKKYYKFWTNSGNRERYIFSTHFICQP